MPCVIIFKSGQEIERVTGGHAVDIIEERLRKCLEA
jgi:hypothetical protein